MGLDKLRLLTPRRPSQEFFDRINAEFALEPAQRQWLNFSNRLFLSPENKAARNPGIGDDSAIRISTKSGVVPRFFVELNFLAPGGKEPPKTILECNPNKFVDGCNGLKRLVHEIFSDDGSHLKLSRVDLNADVEDVSVDYFRHSIRIPAKRKSAVMMGMREIWNNKGPETFYVGKAPSQLRCYDKIQELRYQGEDVEMYPSVLTRLEWEFRHNRCPVEYLSDLPLLQDAHPFMGLQLIETSSYYDYRVSPKESMKRRLFNALVDDLGSHDAVRVFNSDRHFARDFKNVVIDNKKLKEKIEASYTLTTQRFFQGKGADVRFIYRNDS